VERGHHRVDLGQLPPSFSGLYFFGPRISQFFWYSRFPRQNAVPLKVTLGDCNDFHAFAIGAAPGLRLMPELRIHLRPL
jgi:hypothetical protein